MKQPFKLPEGAMDKINAVESIKIEQDRLLYGSGFAKDGKHVPISEVLKSTQADEARGVCQHGGLKRKCEICEYTDEVSDLHTQIAERDAQLAAWDSLVSDFLDADSAWDNDEIEQEDYTLTIDALRKHLYEVRPTLATRQPTQAEDLFKKHGIKYFDRDPMHDPWGWDGCKWYYSTPEQALEAKLKEAGMAS